MYIKGHEDVTTNKQTNNVVNIFKRDVSCRMKPKPPCPVMKRSQNMDTLLSALKTEHLENTTKWYHDKI